MKILATTPIPTQDLFALRNELTVLSDRVEKLLRYSFVEDPKAEASSDPKAEPSAEPQKEASSEEAISDENLNGFVVHKAPTKPFEMIIE